MPFLSDSFTDTDSTLLQNHTPETGGVWFRRIGANDFDIIDNRARSPQVDGDIIYTNDASNTNADYYMKTLARSGGTQSGISFGAVVRKQSGASTYYRAFLFGGSNGSRGLRLEKVISGTPTTLGTDHLFDWASFTDYSIKLEAIGSSIKVYLNDVEEISATDSAITGQGEPGLYANMDGSTSAAFDSCESDVAGIQESIREMDFDIRFEPINELVTIIESIREMDFDIRFEPISESVALTPPVGLWATTDLDPSDNLNEYVTLVEFVQTIASLPENEPVSGFYKGIISSHPVVNEETTESIFGIRTKGSMEIDIDNSDGELEESVEYRNFAMRVWQGHLGNLKKIYQGKIRGYNAGFDARVRLHDLVASVFKENLGRPITTAEFPKAKDLGNKHNIAVGRVPRLPLWNIEWDDANSIYRYSAGEGVGYGGGNWSGISQVYEEDAALSKKSGTIASATINSLQLEIADRVEIADFYVKWFITPEGQTPRAVSAYDSDTGTITPETNFDSAPSAGQSYEIKEWRFYDGSQSSPYAGIAFVELRLRKTDGSRILQLFADCDAFQAEKNFVRFAQSILSNQTWGKGLSVDTSSFDTAAALSEITALLCEGALVGDENNALIDITNKILQVRNMTLTNNHTGIGIEVDTAKTSVGTFGLNDGAWENILKGSFRGIDFEDSDSIIQSLTANYRYDYRKDDYLQKELTRQANTEGENREMELPFVYSHETADRILDFLRKEYIAISKSLSVAAMKDFEIVKNDRVTITVKHGNQDGTKRTVIDSDWQIVDVEDGKDWNIKAKPYIESKYTYEASGSLPIDEIIPGLTSSAEIPPDFGDTPPDPLANVNVSVLQEAKPDGTTISYILAIFDPPESNYSETKMAIRENGQIPYDSAGQGIDRIRSVPVVEGKIYDIQLTPYNAVGSTPGIASSVTGFLITGDATIPKTPTGLTADVSKFGVLSWKWSEVTQNTDNSSIEDLAGYEWQLSDSSGSTVYASGFTEDTRKDLNVNSGNLTSTLTRYLRVRAVDNAHRHTQGGSGNASSWTSRVLASTGSIVTGDIGVGQVSNAASFENTGLTSSNQPASASLSIQSSNSIVKIRFRATMAASAGLIISLLRNGNSIYSDIPNAAYGGTAALDYDDANPTAGFTTYTIQVGNTPGLRNRTLDILETKV